MFEWKTFCLLFCVCLCQAFGQDKLRGKDGRVFSLFSVVTFPNEQCSAASSSTSQSVLGTCFSSSECSDKGGVADGNCAAGFGVCCTFLVSTCGSTVSQNCTYIQNPSYPTAYKTNSACKFNVAPISSDICQLRLDLDNFDLADNADTGACVDTFSVTSGSSRVYYNLCGILTGQHIYIETGSVTTNQEISFTADATSGSVSIRMKVSQIECFSTSKAPLDCLQYFTGVSNTVTSFNYPTNILQEIEYTICVRQEVGTCGIQWTPSDLTTTDPFNLDDTLQGLAANAPGHCVAFNTMSGASISDAYLIISGSANGVYGGADLCDDATATAANQDHGSGAVEGLGLPYRLSVVSHAATSATIATMTTTAVGFSLEYRQIPCSSPRQTPTA